MASSESEDFESADEGPHDGSPNKKERKKRLSSSNYSEPTNEPEEERKKVIPTEDKKLTSNVSTQFNVLITFVTLYISYSMHCILGYILL